jgi:5'-3' exonuclease
MVRMYVTEYYPREVEFFADPKGRSWRSIPMIPFVDAHVLVEATGKLHALLTPEEQLRDSFGPGWVFSYSNEYVCFACSVALLCSGSNHSRCVVRLSRAHRRSKAYFPRSMRANAAALRINQCLCQQANRWFSNPGCFQVLHNQEALLHCVVLLHSAAMSGLVSMYLVGRVAMKVLF